MSKNDVGGKELLHHFKDFLSSSAIYPNIHLQGYSSLHEYLPLHLLLSPDPVYEFLKEAVDGHRRSRNHKKLFIFYISHGEYNTAQHAYDDSDQKVLAKRLLERVGSSYDDTEDQRAITQFLKDLDQRDSLKLPEVLDFLKNPKACFAPIPPAAAPPPLVATPAAPSPPLVATPAAAPLPLIATPAAPSPLVVTPAPEPPPSEATRPVGTTPSTAFHNARYFSNNPLNISAPPTEKTSIVQSEKERRRCRLM